jgi:hypothetical protein
VRLFSSNEPQREQSDDARQSVKMLPSGHDGAEGEGNELDDGDGHGSVLGDGCADAERLAELDGVDDAD